jgi:general secretion pathway protein N
MKLWRASLLVGVSALVTAGVMAPAAWLNYALPAPLALQYPSGSLWKGEALLVGPRPICPLAWRVKEVGWLRARVAISLSGPCSGQAVVEWTPQSIVLRQGQIQFAAARIADIAPLARSWQTAGQLEWQARDFTLWPRTAGEGRVIWRDLRLATLPVARLGDYEAHFTVAGQKLSAQVSTLQGPLMLEGRLGWDGQKPQVDLLANSTDAQIESWVKTLGLPAGGARYRLLMP